MSTQLLEVAGALRAAGFQIAAIGEDKKPAHKRGFMSRDASDITDEAISKVRAGTADGIRVELGTRGRRQQGVPLALEFEGRATADEGWAQRWSEQIELFGLDELWARLDSGVVQRTPSGGRRWFFQVPDVDEESMPAAAQALWRGGKGESLVMAELLTNNAIVAPSAGRTHKTGRPYEALLGDLASDLPDVTLDEVDALRLVLEGASDEGTAAAAGETLRTVNALSRHVRAAFRTNGGSPSRSLDLLLEAGWSVLHGSLPDEVALIRPGSSSRTPHAHVGGKGRSRGQVSVWTTSEALPAGRHDAFSLEAHLRFDGDADRAARTLMKSTSMPTMVLRAVERPLVDVGPNADSIVAIQQIVDAIARARSSHDPSQPLILRQVTRDGKFIGLRLPRRGMPPRNFDEKASGAVLLQVLQPVTGWKTKKDDEGVTSYIPQHAHTIPVGLREAAYREATTLSGLATVEIIAAEPVILPSGRIVAEPGYHRDERVLIAAQASAHAWWAESYSVPERPDREDAQAALDFLLTDVFPDFPFIDDGDRAVAVAELLTSCAPHLARKRPAFNVSAPDRGTGKTLIHEAIRLIATGSTVGAELSPFKSRDDENSKVLGMALLDDLRFAGTDNVDTGATVTSTLMTRLITKEDGAESVRILGASEGVPATGLVWQFSGNLIEFGGDLQRRVLSCELEVNEGLAFERDGFRHPELLRWIGDNRPKLLAAVHTIIAHGLQNPVDHGDLPFRVASFEEWSRVFVGAMSHLTINSQNAAGLLALGRDEFIEKNDADAEEWGEFLEWLATVTENKPLTAGEVIGRIQPPVQNGFFTSPPPTVAIPDSLDSVLHSGQVNSKPRRAASVLKKMGRRKVVWGDQILRLVEHKTGEGTKSKKSTRWSVEVRSRRGFAEKPGLSCAPMKPKADVYDEDAGAGSIPDPMLQADLVLSARPDMEFF